MTKRPSQIELRKFAYIMAVAFILVFALFVPWYWSIQWPRWPWIVALVFFVWGSIHPGSLYPVHTTWMKIGHVLGWFNSRIILSLVFYLMILPFGLVRRMVSKKDPLSRNWDKQCKTYRVVSQDPAAENLEKPF